MFSDTTLNRIYDRGSSVYNYSLGEEGFTNLTKDLVIIHHVFSSVFAWHYSEKTSQLV